MPSYIFGTVGVWTGCGLDTIPIVFPPPQILGYDACVPPILSNPTDDGPFSAFATGDNAVQGPHVIV